MFRNDYKCYEDVMGEFEVDERNQEKTFCTFVSKKKKYVIPVY